MPCNISRHALSAWASLGLLCGGSLPAQPALPPAQVKIDSAALRAAAAVADTGRMMPGYRDISRYNTPGFCYAALRRTTSSVWRRGEADTLSSVSRSDTLPAFARDVARRCMARMTPETVAPSELNNLMRLAVHLGDTTLAARVTQRRLAEASRSARDRGYIVLDLIEETFQSHPANFAFAERWLAYFDTMPRDSISVEQTLTAYGHVVNGASTRFDTGATVRLIRNRALYMRTVSEAVLEFRGPARGATYSDSLGIVWFQSPPDLVDKLRGLGERSLEKYLSIPDVRLLVTSLVTQASLVGTRPPALSGIAWYSSYPSPRPEPGRITLMVSRTGQWEPGRMDGQLAVVRRIYERYHDQGLDVIVAVSTQGYRWGSPPLEPAKEAKILGWYYREYLRLPFSILVEETKFDWLPDGRRVPKPAEKTMMSGLIGRDGTIRGFPSLANEAELDAYIRRELARR